MATSPRRSSGKAKKATTPKRGAPAGSDPSPTAATDGLHLACRTCGLTKEASHFGIKGDSPTGRSTQCKPCRNEYARNRWYPENRAKQIAASRAWKRANPARVIAVRHRLDVSAVEEVMGSTDACGICGTKHDLVLDHCHDSLKPRGRLCRPCNTLVGRLGDSPDAVRATAERVLAYLEAAPK